MPRPATCPCSHQIANHTRTVHNGQPVHAECHVIGCLCLGYGSGDYTPHLTLIPRARVEAALATVRAA